MRVKAKRSMPYGRRHYAAGDVIEMSARDAKLLTAVGRVGPADDVPVRSAPMEEPKGKKEKGYRRRDMRAEDQPREDDTGEE